LKLLEYSVVIDRLASICHVEMRTAELRLFESLSASLELEL